MTDLTCESGRELISAGIDGELHTEDERKLDAHLQGCTSCCAYQDDAFALRRALRLGVVDNHEAATTDVDLVGSLRDVSILRYVLFVVGATLAILNASSIVSPGGSASAHLARHDGVFGTALGVAMVAVAAKPHRAIGLVPLTSTIILLMAIAATADLASGNTNPLGEAVHIIEFAGLMCLWLISGGPSRLPAHRARFASLFAWLRHRQRPG